MNLSTEEFADIVQTLSVPPTDARRDKRRAPRVVRRCRVPIFLGSEPGGGPMEVVSVRDLSPRGVCLLHHNEIPRGTQFVVQLQRGGGPPVHLLARVAHCRCEGKTLYIIGAEFTCLVDPPPHAAAPQDAARDLDRIRRSVLD